MANSPVPPAVMGEEVLLTTKLYIPPPRPDQVARPHLLDRLDAALRLGHKLTLISAPPGFGKTTLLSAWVHQNTMHQNTMQQKTGLQTESGSNGAGTVSPANVAWLSLDENDNEPRRFLRYGVAALQRVASTVGAKTLAALNNQSLQPDDVQPVLSTLINELAALPHPLVLILDDYHLITSPTIQRGLTFLLDNLPPQLRVVIASRTEAIALPLARLRSRAKLTELRGTDLRFTPAEASIFLQQTMGLTLNPHEITALESRTEGWIAGLQMAALSLQGRPAPDTAGFVQAFTGSHRYILDYLLEEVLDRQPPAVQQFLLHTAVLDRLCGPLCDAVLAVAPEKNDALTLPPGQTVLEQLEQANLFIVPLDQERYWYRYHHLFAELLRHRLKQSFAGSLSGLHHRASRWFEQHGLDTEAMHHALAAVDIDRVVRLAKQKAIAMLSRSEAVTVIGWLDALPDELVRSQPGVSLLRAWAAMLTGQLEAVEDHLQRAEQEFMAAAQSGTQPNIAGEAAALRAIVAYFRRDMARVIEFCEQALAHLPSDNLFVRGIVMQVLGAAHSWQGQVLKATEAFTEAAAISRNTRSPQVHLIAVWNLGQLQAEQGRLKRAAEIFRQGIPLVDPAADDPARESLLPLLGRLHLGLAGLLQEWNDLPAAEEEVTAGLHLGESTDDAGTLISGYLVQARLRQLQGKTEAAFEAIQRANRFARRFGGPHYWSVQVGIAQARLWLGQGNLRAVAQWLQTRDLQPAPLPESIPYLREAEYLVLVRLLLAQAQQSGPEPPLAVESPLATALTILEKIAAAADAGGRTGRLIEALLLQALVRHAQDKTVGLVPFEQALALAEPAGYVRLFIDEGQPMLELLKLAAAQGIGPGYVPRLLAAIKHSPAASGVSPLLDPLSDREQEILQLIATGMSNKELAETLVLTVGTVKWHLNNIYSKLDVRSRTQAVAKARQLGLL